jgi:hypothetical protein
MKGKPGGRGGVRARTQTAIVVAFSLLCSTYVAARMIQSSRITDALVHDLNDADAGGAGFGSEASLAGLPRLTDDARATIVGPTLDRRSTDNDGSRLNDVLLNDAGD